MAKTGMPSSTSAAATSSWVESGLLAQSTASAPPAFKASARFAVSVVICAQTTTANAVKRPLAVELIPDLAQHRHLAGRPIDSAPPLGGQTRILDIERARVGHRLHHLSVSSNRLAREPALRQIPIDGATQPFGSQCTTVLWKSRIETIDKFSRGVRVLLAAVLLHRVRGGHRTHAARDLERQAQCQALEHPGAIGVATAGRLDQRLGR